MTISNGDPAQSAIARGWSDLLRQAGEALYGPRWQSPLAVDLGVSDRTVRMWLSGRMRPRPEILIALADLVVRRQAQLGTVAERLAAAIGAVP
ncbi:MAG TPA: helix-turn-helix transcriptional regulator [Stellaceae bacterium]|nr:helix-turn-helix transcriptional regulator [Stellaceae bacterium]